MRRKEIIILIVCTLVGFGLRFYHFDTKSLWMDEVHTFDDSRDGFKDQIKFYKENPAFLHPPLFFILTHQFYPFTKPERDLRIIPLIFGTLSIPMIFFLSRSFSPRIALPCMVSLTLTTYHISLSQDGRSYSLLMFLGMAGLFFFIKHLQTSKKRYLLPVASLFSTLFYASYSSIPFIALSQILWFYRPKEQERRPTLSKFFILNGFILLLCLPWIIFVLLNYKGQPLMDPFHTENPGPFLSILYGVIHDWVLNAPLAILSITLLTLYPFFTKNRKNAFILLAIFVLPIGGLHIFCRLLNITHFITSRYFVNFLPLFLITLYVSIDAFEIKFERLKRSLRFKLLFIILFIASNLVILPPYYRSEKQDLRGLVSYLKGQVRGGDKIFVGATGYIPGILHYFEIYPEGRHQRIPFATISEKEIEYWKPFAYRNRMLSIHYSKKCCTQYVADGSRLWIVVGKWTAKKIRQDSPCVLKGYFDGSFLNFNRFPFDASMYLFLWDPLSPNEKGIDMPIE